MPAKERLKLELKEESASILHRLLAWARKGIETFRTSKHKARLVLVAIFVLLILFGLLTFIGRYFTGSNLRHGFMDVSGRIEAYEYHAGTKVAGKVMEVFVDEGQEVVAGQPIARIQSKQLAAAMEQARSRFALAEIEFRDNERLFERKAISQLEFNRYEKQYAVAREALVAAEADLEDALVVSPTDGTVVTKIVRPGEVVAVGTPIVSLVNLDKLYFQTFLATDWAGKVSLNDEVRVFPDALPDDTFEARVSMIAPKAQFTPKNVETKSQRAKLVFRIKCDIVTNPEHKLKPGMPASGAVRIEPKASWKAYDKT